MLCRSDIIEILLNAEYIKPRTPKIIEDSIEKTGYYWLEYEYEKVKKMGSICRFYLEDIETHEMILAHSALNEEIKRGNLYLLINEIETIFTLALEHLNNKTYHSRITKNPEVFVNALQSSFNSGELTTDDREGVE